MSVIIGADNDRERSKQTAIGVSQLGGCRKQVWLKLQNTPETNKGLRLASWMGTAIHDSIERAFKRAIEIGEVNPGILLEHRIEAANGLPPATVDFYDPETKTIVDWKSIKLAGVPYFGKLQQRYQVNTYAYIFNQNGLPVEWVQLFGIPRDGTENDLVDSWIEPYSEETALEALAWLKDVESRTEAPEPEMSGVFCRDYCPFFGELCAGIPKDFTGEPITDDLVTKAALRYKEILVEEKALAAEKDAAKEALQGVTGVTFDGVKISWSEVAGRQTPDLDAIKTLLPEVPMKNGLPSVRLSVR